MSYNVGNSQDIGRKIKHGANVVVRVLEKSVVFYCYMELCPQLSFTNFRRLFSVMVKSWWVTLEFDCLGSSPSSVTYQHCDTGQERAVIHKQQQMAIIVVFMSEWI